MDRREKYVEDKNKWILIVYVEMDVVMVVWIGKKNMWKMRMSGYCRIWTGVSETQRSDT